MLTIVWTALLCITTLSCTEGSELSRYYNNYDSSLKELLINSSEPVDLEYYTYRERVHILQVMIREECKDGSLNRRKREILSEVKKTKLQVEKVLYERMIRMLIECRSKKGKTTSQPQTTSQLPTTSTWKTTSPPSTTRAPPPAACQSAINLAESWRTDTLGSHIQPISNFYNCDTTNLRNIWFRFTGDAGNMMLDECPPEFSCGTQAGIWSDERMPVNVGSMQPFIAYVSWNNNCTEYPLSMQAMRCSNDVPNDFIYRISSIDYYCFGFCGMSKLN